MKKSKSKEDKIETKSEQKPETKIFWQAPEFEYRRKNISWYWLSLMVVIILLALAFWQKNFLFAVFVIIAWLVIIYLSRRLPTVWKFKLGEKGIELSLPNDDPSSVRFYSFGEIEGFDIHPENEPDSTAQPVGEYKELVLKIKKRFSPYLKINFHSSDEEKIKNFLRKFIPQKGYAVSLADSISKLIGF